MDVNLSIGFGFLTEFRSRPPIVFGTIGEDITLQSNPPFVIFSSSGHIDCALEGKRACRHGRQILVFSKCM